MQIELLQGGARWGLTTAKRVVSGPTYRPGFVNHEIPTNSIYIWCRVYITNQEPILYFRSDDDMRVHKFRRLFPTAVR